MLTIDLLNEMIRPVVHEINSTGMRYPRRPRAAVSTSPLVMESMQHLMTAYGRSVQARRQIIDFPPSLLELLARTDVDDIPLNAIRMPCSTQCFHFGPQPDLELEAGWLVDGAYVEAGGEPGDVWPTGTPEALKTKASTGQGKEVRLARSQLAALGYVPVRLCGQQVEEQRQRIGASGSPGAGHPSTHWRRRHWRNQAHGPDRALRKLIWIVPMLVGQNHPDQAGSGHLYRVSPDDSRTRPRWRRQILVLASVTPARVCSRQRCRCPD